jgi:hypothetical protein
MVFVLLGELCQTVLEFPVDLHDTLDLRQGHLFAILGLLFRFFFLAIMPVVILYMHGEIINQRIICCDIRVYASLRKP